MSFYNANIKTHFIDPIYSSSKFRAEFRIPSDKLFLANMRLCNIGLNAGSASQYNSLLGAYNVKNIILYDGNTVLSSILNFQEFMAFKLGYNQSNNNNNYLRRYTAKNRMGYDVKSSGKISVGGEDYIGVSRDNTSQSYGQRGLKNLAWLNLRECFGILNSLNSVSTKQFQNLRIEIIYNTDNRMLQDNTAVISNEDPILVVDEVTGGSFLSQNIGGSGSVQWTDIEHDAVTIPAVSSTSASVKSKTQTNTFKINGFNDKQLGRILLVNTPTVDRNFATGTSNTSFANKGSQALINQKTQFIVNNRFLLPGSGIEKEQERLSYLNDSWGKMNTFPFNNGSNGMSDTTKGNKFDADVSDRLNQSDYTGITINDRISTLEVKVSRDGVYNSESALAASDGKYNQAIRLNVFGEVAKALQKKGDGRYDVVYV